MIRTSHALRIAPAVAASLLSLVCAAAAAQDVYEWKDAQGVTHYSEAPPKNGAYKQRDVNRDRAPAGSTGAEAPATSPPPVKTASAGKTAPSPQCVTARQNLSLLESKGTVQQDVDGDGKPDKTLSDSERASQLELARAQLKAQNCG